jgi:hypothetical protein
MIIIPNRALWAELTAVSMATSNATQSRYIVIGVATSAFLALFHGATGIDPVADRKLCLDGPHASAASFSIISPSASIPAAKQKRSKLAETSSMALPTGLRTAGSKAVAVVLLLFMALLSFRGISTPSLQAQGEQRRPSFFNIRRDIPSPRQHEIVGCGSAALGTSRAQTRGLAAQRRQAQPVPPLG